jgi:hypothetical protein
MHLATRFLVTLAALTLLPVCSEQRKVEELLGVSFPPTARNIEIHRVQPSPDLAATAYYVRFDVDEPGYHQFVSAVGLASGARCITTPFTSSLGQPPPFWDIPERDPSPPLLGRCVGGAGENQSIIATHHRQRAYLLIERVPEASPGPF